MINIQSFKHHLSGIYATYCITEILPICRLDSSMYPRKKLDTETLLLISNTYRLELMINLRPSLNNLH